MITKRSTYAFAVLLVLISTLMQKDAPATDKFPKKPQILRVLLGGGVCRTVDFDKTGTRLVSAQQQGYVSIWNVTNGESAWRTRSANSGCSSAFFSPDGSHILIALEDNTASLVNVRDRSKLQTDLRSLGNSERYHSFSRARFNKSGTFIVTAGSDKIVSIWNAKTLQLHLSLEGQHVNGVNDACFSPDGSEVATASSDGTVKFWDARNGRFMHSLDADGYEVFSTCFSPDGLSVGAGVSLTGAGTAQIFDRKTGVEKMRLDHSDNVMCVTYDRKGSRIATASWDGTAKVWNARTGALLYTLSGHQNRVNYASFSPDGSLLATASEDETVIVWKLPR